MAELPTGTVTFLFTDIEGSTRLLHQLGDRFADALGDHAALLRQAITESGGVEFGSEGDAHFAERGPWAPRIMSGWT
jgi:class 3 adenylate cyclase